MFQTGPSALLVLENGSVYSGTSFGYEVDCLGEVCFNTSMSGYQEILTDPSYSNQIVTLTYPMIGNYGVNPEENESARIQAAGLVVKEYVSIPSNYNSQMSLADFLKEHQIPGIQGLDTRQLVLEIRREGAMRGGIFYNRTEFSPEMLEQIKAFPSMEGRDLARGVSTHQPYEFGEQANKRFRIAVMDYGVKTNILRLLDRSGFAVKVFPAGTQFNDLQQENFDGYFLSNGPGDPASMGYAVETVREILNEGKPVFGICLGHQLIGLAAGHKSHKLKFGHRGGNQPVRNDRTGRVEITSQNHGFVIDPEETAIQKGVQVTHVNLNDNTVEGFRDQHKPLMCVQYHPEAAPGPHDAAYLFNDFFQMVDEYQRNR